MLCGCFGFRLLALFFDRFKIGKDSALLCNFFSDREKKIKTKRIFVDSPSGRRFLSSNLPL